MCKSPTRPQVSSSCSNNSGFHRLQDAGYPVTAGETIEVKVWINEQKTELNMKVEAPQVAGMRVESYKARLKAGDVPEKPALPAVTSPDGLYKTNY